MEAHVLAFILHEHRGRRLRKSKWGIKQRPERGQGGAADTGLSRGGGPLHSGSAPIITVMFCVCSVATSLHKLENLLGQPLKTTQVLLFSDLSLSLGIG